MKTRNIREVKVGDKEIKRKTIIELKNMAFSLNEEAITPMEQNRQIGRIRKVLLATLEYIEDLYEPSEEYKDTFQQNTEVGVDDSEEVEFTKRELEIIKELLTECEGFMQVRDGYERYRGSFGLINLKLYKMLKDKGEEERSRKICR